MDGLYSVGYFLVTLIFGMAIFVLWLRIGLQYFRVNGLHPIAQTVYRLTDPIVHPITKLLQMRSNRHRRYDPVSIGILIALVWIKYWLISGLIGAYGALNGWMLAVLTVADLLIQPCHILFYAILIRVIMSWVNPHWRHPLTTVLFMITEPMLQWARRALPHIAGLDFSPLIIMAILKIISLFVTASLPLPLV